jgi:hypothetical protein
MAECTAFPAAHVAAVIGPVQAAIRTAVKAADNPSEPPSNYTAIYTAIGEPDIPAVSSTYRPTFGPACCIADTEAICAAEPSAVDAA